MENNNIKFICVAKCPELDMDSYTHCIDTKEEIRSREDKCQDYCPCGNNPIWEEIID